LVIKSLPDQYSDDPDCEDCLMEQNENRLTARHDEEHIPAIQLWIQRKLHYED
jgi:hypothetical protein